MYEPRYPTPEISAALADAEARLEAARNRDRAKKGLPPIGVSLEAMGIPPRAPTAWELPKRQERLYEIVARPGVKRRQAIETELFGDAISAPARLSGMMARLRENLAPLGIKLPYFDYHGRLAPLALIGAENPPPPDRHESVAS